MADTIDISVHSTSLPNGYGGSARWPVIPASRRMLAI
jgi:hypothetical protein